jgi:hypothetical protein
VKSLDKQVVEGELLTELLEGILSKKDEIRSNSFNRLMRISEDQPELLYPKYDYLANLLDSDNHYQRNIAINLIANLALIDTENKFEKIFDKYFSNIDGNRTMVAGQAAINSGKIARAKPNLRTKITKRLLNLEKTHKGKHVDLIIAYAIEAFEQYFKELSNKKEILVFIKTQLESKSPKTRKLAREFLKKNERDTKKSL